MRLCCHGDFHEISMVITGYSQFRVALNMILGHHVSLDHIISYKISLTDWPSLSLIDIESTPPPPLLPPRPYPFSHYPPLPPLFEHMYRAGGPVLSSLAYSCACTLTGRSFATLLAVGCPGQRHFDADQFPAASAVRTTNDVTTAMRC